MSILFDTYKVGEDLDMGASFVSEKISLVGKRGYSLHSIYTGSPVGTITVEASIDGENFTTVADSSTAISAAGDTLFDIGQANYLWARLRYARTSGSGSMDILGSVKE